MFLSWAALSSEGHWSSYPAECKWLLWFWKVFWKVSQQGQSDLYVWRHGWSELLVPVAVGLVMEAPVPLSCVWGSGGLLSRSSRELELMGHYLTLLASLEHHLHTAQNHQRTLNELVDLVDLSKTWGLLNKVMWLVHIYNTSYQQHWTLQ